MDRNISAFRFTGIPGIYMRLEQRFQVDNHRVLACSDDVFIVEVASLQSVQQSKVLPLMTVEPVHLIRRSAGFSRDILDPSVSPTIQNVQHPKRRISTALVQP